MHKLIKKIFNCYNFEYFSISKSKNIDFYKTQQADIANYFITYLIDCRDFEKDENRLKQALEKLEEEYVGELGNAESSLKMRIKKTFSDAREISQFDKNVSAIYLLLFDDIEKIKTYRNLVYSIEESSNYFKRYVLPYTNDQVENLSNSIKSFSDKSVVETLNKIVNDDSAYEELLKGSNFNSTYGLVVRMFSKLPFLQYNFLTELAPEPITTVAENNLSDNLKKYHKLLSTPEISIETLYSIASETKKNDLELEKELTEMLEGGI